MPKEIPIKITIDNRQAKGEAKEVQDEVKKVGKEGKKAGDKVGKSFVDGFRKAKKSIMTVKNSMMGLVAIVATGAFASMAKEALKAADNIAKTANKIGLTTDALQEYQFAASQSGIKMRTFNMSFQRFGRRIAEVAIGTGELLKTTQQYNFEVKKQDGTIKDINTLFSEYGELIRTAATDQEALRLAFKAFDSEGAVMVNLFRGGTKTLAEYISMANELGLVLSEEVIGKSTEVVDKLDILKKQLGVTFTTAIVDNAEALASSFGLIAKAAGSIGRGMATRSRFETVKEASQLDVEGMLDFKKFREMTYYEGQQYVDAVKDIFAQVEAIQQGAGPRSRWRGVEEVGAEAPPESEQDRIRRVAKEREEARLAMIVAEEAYVQRMDELNQELEFQVNKEIRDRKAGSEAIIELINKQKAEEEYGKQQDIEDWGGVFDDWGDSVEVAEDKWGAFRDMVKDSSHDMTEAFVDFAMTGKASVKDMIDSMIKDFLRFALQKAIFGPLMGGLADMFPGPSDIKVPIEHTGSGSVGMNREITFPTRYTGSDSVGMTRSISKPVRSISDILISTKHTGSDSIGMTRSISDIILPTKHTGSDSIGMSRSISKPIRSVSDIIFPTKHTSSDSIGMNRKIPMNGLSEIILPTKHTGSDSLGMSRKIPVGGISNILLPIKHTGSDSVGMSRSITNIILPTKHTGGDSVGTSRSITNIILPTKHTGGDSVGTSRSIPKPIRSISDILIPTKHTGGDSVGMSRSITNIILPTKHTGSDSVGTSRSIPKPIRSISDILVPTKHTGGDSVGMLRNIMVPTKHTGGDSVGMLRNIMVPTSQGSDPVAMPSSLPIFHNGLRGNEYPAILERGEEVSTKEQVRAGGREDIKIEVIVVRGSGDKTRTEERQDSGSGVRQLMIMVGDDIARGGPVAQTIEGTYNLVRKGRVV